ncbi:MAG: hypothetical protein O9335_15560 [Inhella sp.]|jgi:hypothetical protein|uniref:hypothetical protein n=1 Tax=Inhella sp. TaxID=1921806 RepID=UPI0022C35733|nr:hypothetical protein [Inhella sp.]MCZ8236568.1 hypothetical protein [Inhella sp.]
MRRAKTAHPVTPTAPSPAPPADDRDERLSRIQERPDGYHWTDAEGRQEFGPFDSIEAALTDMEGPVEQVLEQRAWAEQTLQGLAPDEPSDLSRDDPVEGPV